MADFKSAAAFRERKKALLFYKYKHKQASYERAQQHPFLNFFVDVTASHFPIGHRLSAHLFHKEQREFAKTGGAFFPRAPIKTSFGKVAAFYPSLSQCFFATSFNKLQERSSESRLLETKSQVREEGGDEIG